MSESSVIVKVQRPLSGPPAKPNQCLIYAAGRRRMQTQEVSVEVMTALGEDAKGYFHATWSPAFQMWLLDGRVPDQDW